MIEKEQIKKVLPVYSLTNIEEIPNNPYREFAYYAGYTVYPEMENTVNISFSNFANLPHNEQEQVLRLPETIVPGTTAVFKTPSHEKIMFDCEYSFNGTYLCNIKFYSYYAFSGDGENYAVELNFQENPIFDFLGIDKTENNFFDFIADDENPAGMDMVFAFVKTFANSVDFLKTYKAKTIITKNIKLFAEKLVKPLVSDMSILFTPNYFIIGVIHGIDIIKGKYEYENYLNSIKEFAEDLKKTYGDISPVDNDSEKK